MNTELFWEMHADGRLGTLAEKDPLGFIAVCEASLEEATQSDSSRQYADNLSVQILWEGRTHDCWIQVSQHNPELFEWDRTRFFEAHIRLNGSERNIERNTRLQWRINREREKHANPIGACVALSNLMWDQVWRENGFYDAVQGKVLPPSMESSDSPSSKVGMVLDFRPK